MKPFKTYEEQIELLKVRGLIVDDEKFAISRLTANNYFNVINCYKKMFVMNLGTENERFNPSVKFKDLFNLYKFDKDLKLTFFKYILKIESLLKSVISYVFCKNHMDGDYFNLNNYRTSLDGTNYQPRDVIQELKNKDYSKTEIISHYSQNGEKAPFWVFINTLYWGEIAKLFTILLESDQREIANIISLHLNQTIYFDEMISYLKELTYVRNICAHDQKLYDYSSYINVYYSNWVMRKIRLDKRPKGIFKIMIILKTFLEPNDFVDMSNELLPVFSDMQKIPSLNQTVFYNKMRLPKDWFTILN